MCVHVRVCMCMCVACVYMCTYVHMQVMCVYVQYVWVCVQKMATYLPYEEEAEASASLSVVWMTTPL